MTDITALIWDDWNVAHIARHDLSKDEVEQVCQGAYVSWETFENRVMVVGETVSGRLVSIVLGDKGKGIYYPVTARTASAKERRRYFELKGGEQAA